ncbi:MAG TPA: DCC1-like thiol-disulfide oxidoreductase family protein [Edaphocola sp.]|nr:DCC1-like thiol-disulfide oxidoreductase family protein [Edaphocola sp.]
MKSIDTYKNALVLYDGDCGFCNRSVLFILKRDQKDYFRFVALQSPLGIAIKEQYNIQSDSIVLIEKETAYEQSEAVLKIGKHLRFLKTISALALYLPRGLSNKVYDIIARNRLKFFPNNNCELPKKEWQHKFL